MSEQVSEVQKTEKAGCGFLLGMLLLAAAVCGVVFYFIIVPMLEKDEFNSLKKQAGDAVVAVSDKLAGVKDKVSEKITDITEKDEVKESIKNVKEFGESADLPAVVDTVKSSGKEIVDKTSEDVDGWY